MWCLGMLLSQDAALNCNNSFMKGTGANQIALLTESRGQIVH